MAPGAVFRHFGKSKISRLRPESAGFWQHHERASLSRTTASPGSRACRGLSGLLNPYLNTTGPNGRGAARLTLSGPEPVVFRYRLRNPESPRRSRLPGLAALLGRVAPCGACIVRVRRERLALSVRQESVDRPAEISSSVGAYLNTAGVRQCSDRRWPTQSTAGWDWKGPTARRLRRR